MRRRLIVRPEAEAEARGTALWYEREQPGLGDRFLDELDVLIARILAMPRQFPVMEKDIRRALLPRFPYGVFFAHRDEQVVVMAILHTHQDPVRWRGRLQDG